jgi:hypothetical protein
MLWSYVLKGDVGEQLCSPWHVIIVGINLHLIGFRLSPDFATLYLLEIFSFLFSFFIIHVCKQGLGHFSPLEIFS